MKNTLIKIVFCILATIPFTAIADNDICSNILSVINSPSNINSSCSTPFKKVFVELNYIDQQLPDHSGTQQNFPNADLRIGLPSNSEFFVYPSNYIDQKSFPGKGTTDTRFGLKHTINYKKNWIFALQGIADTPTGSFAYGSNHWGVTFNGITYYEISNQLSIMGQLGISRLSDPKLSGGNYFNTINPDVCLSFSPSSRVSLYGEIYGQSKISATQGAGFNFDGGILFLVFPNTIVNLSGGQQLYNYLGNFKHYINLGIAVLL
ncbi:Uncharacterised protein [Legionella steigerwaltii]|uniref:Transporter n=1 Tax=Legionella steigerwaltii TaxID=460 RepID=A0A378L9K0_9GAMM|nr:transporter [Legionella steigerwaltii]KTD75754.1 hypothetical protein Lstg_2433 [Legionella steigerwaltii]STY23735.1 Uncharacterised protein [Legionella steigerwaltii]